MKTLLALTLCCITAGASAQQERPRDEGLRETRYPDPRGDLIVRHGQPPARPAEARPAFANLDRNGDGVVDASEASGYITLANDFDYADTNNDGRISRREFDRW